MLLTSSFQLDLLIVSTILAYLFYRHALKSHKYWAKKGVYNPKPLPLFGNFLKVVLFKTTIGEWLKDYYDTIQEKYFGLYIFEEPFLVVKDPEIIKRILITDFNNFTDRNMGTPSHEEVHQHFLILQKGPTWKSTRSLMTPIFTTGKLKGMLPLINSCGEDLKNWISQNLGIHETKELATKYSTNVIAKCAFGIDSQCFTHENNMFLEMGKKFFDFSWRNAVSQTIYFMKASWVEKFNINFIGQDVIDYFRQIFLDILKSRPDSHKYNDLIDMLKELIRKKVIANDGSDDAKLAGIAIILFMASLETTSSTISFILYEFCKNMDIQSKARIEIQAVLEKYGGKLTYEAVNDCVYLDMCIKETLRRYPVVPFLDRTCTSKYIIPGTNLEIEKGTAILIPVYGLHMDENYFPEPYKYDPDRFLNKIDSNDGLYYVPFGEGQRLCIGKRFGELGTKVALIHILNNFKVEKCVRTPDPIEFEPKSFLFGSKVGLPMRFKPL